MAARYSKEKSERISTRAEKCIDRLSNKIIKGDKNAIIDGVSLLDITDAGYSTSIKISLSHALSSNPETVLSELKNNLPTLTWICEIPFIEPEDSFVKQYYKKTRNKLIKIKNEELKESIIHCIDRLDHSYFSKYES